MPSNNNIHYIIYIAIYIIKRLYFIIYKTKFIFLQKWRAMYYEMIILFFCCSIKINIRRDLTLSPIIYINIFQTWCNLKLKKNALYCTKTIKKHLHLMAINMKKWLKSINNNVKSKNCIYNHKCKIHQHTL